jgi:hypothetical protein
MEKNRQKKVPPDHLLLLPGGREIILVGIFLAD